MSKKKRIILDKFLKLQNQTLLPFFPFQNIINSRNNESIKENTEKIFLFTKETERHACF